MTDASREALIADLKQDARVDSMFVDDVRKHRSNRAADMLEADAKDAFAAGMSCRPASAQQVAVPAREPLSEEQIVDWMWGRDLNKLNAEQRKQVHLLIRDVENHHKIKPPQGDTP